MTYQAGVDHLPAALGETGRVLVAGGLAGGAFWGLTYPVDVIKSSMQADSVHRNRRTYASMADCLRQKLRAGGAAALFRGFTPCMVRAMPANAFAWFGYESSQKAFRWLDALQF